MNAETERYYVGESSGGFIRIKKEDDQGRKIAALVDGRMGNTVWAEAEAKKIVKACNNHYKLVKALQDIKKHCEITVRVGYELSTTWNIANNALEEIK